jgi:hypothetical protein
LPSSLQIDYATNIAQAVQNLKDNVITLNEFRQLQDEINAEFDLRITALE